MAYVVLVGGRFALTRQVLRRSNRVDALARMPASDGDQARLGFVKPVHQATRHKLLHYMKIQIGVRCILLTRIAG